MIKINEDYELEIVDYGSNGEGIAKLNGLTIFVPQTIKGEIVLATIKKIQNNYAIAFLKEIFVPSPNRVETKCPKFVQCGGCQLMHIVHGEQLRIKKNIVKNAFRNIAKIDAFVLPCIESKENFKYRNKIELAVSQNDEGIINIGFFEDNSHNVIAIDNCFLTCDWLSKLILAIKKYMQEEKVSAFNPKSLVGTIKHIVARMIDDSLMLTIVIAEDTLPNQNKLIKILSQEFSSFSLFLNINKGKYGEIFSENFKLVYGEKTQRLTTFEIKHEISPQSFFQINSDIQNKIYQKVLDLIEPNNIVVDAYSGAGLLSAILAKKSKMVYGIEIVEKAVENAKNLARENEIKNMFPLCGDTAKVLPKLSKQIGKEFHENTTVICDPPRKGCDKVVLDCLLCSKPKNIILISCNPATLARDVAYLTNSAKIYPERQYDTIYELSFIQPFDMFPQTRHVETMVQLILKN
ncbi:MAG: 23S rRNA (uracil(1939)-C(5))-methyltransferase RlmD [Clostridia bacterium]